MSWYVIRDLDLWHKSKTAIATSTHLLITSCSILHRVLASLSIIFLPCQLSQVSCLRECVYQSYIVQDTILNDILSLWAVTLLSSYAALILCLSSFVYVVPIYNDIVCAVNDHICACMEGYWAARNPSLILHVRCLGDAVNMTECETVACIGISWSQCITI